MDQIPLQAVAYLQQYKNKNNFMSECSRMVDAKTKVGSFFTQVQRNNPALVIREKLRSEILYNHNKTFNSTCFNFKRHLPKLRESNEPHVNVRRKSTNYTTSM